MSSSKKWLPDTALPIIFMCLAGFVCVSTLVATYQNWLPIPFWDEWGSVAFMKCFLQGELSIQDWFNFHNEHRIVTQRLLTLIDYTFFSGRAAFLIIFAICAQCLHAVVLLCMSSSKTTAVNHKIIKSSVLVLLFSFMSYEIFLWAFEDQITLVCLLASCAFFCYALAQEKHDRGLSTLWPVIGFLISWITAAFTMANGLFIGLVLCIVLALSSRSYRLAVGVGVLFLFFLYLYTHDFIRPNELPPYSNALKDPLGFLRFYLLLIGNPFNLLGKFIDSALGLAGIFLLLFGGWHIWTRHITQPRQIALWGISLFIIISLGSTALGRFSWKFGYPLASRYIAICSIFWAAQVLFWASYAAYSRYLKLLLVLILVTVTCMQVKLLREDKYIAWEPANRVRTAADCLAVGLSDPQFNPIVPDQYILDAISPKKTKDGTEPAKLVQFLKQNSFSFFHDPVTHWVGRTLGDVVSISADGSLIKGHIDLVQRISEGQGVYIRGQATDVQKNKPIKRILLVDEFFTIVGLGTGGYTNALPARGGFPYMSEPAWIGFAKIPPNTGLLAFGLLNDHEACFIGVINAP